MTQRTMVTGNDDPSPTAQLTEPTCSVSQVGDREWFCATHQRNAEDCNFTIQEDVQCGRCGSSMSFEDCGACDDGQVECGDPIQCCDGTHACTRCCGEGGWPVCCSSADWCLANPRPGREDVPRHTAETFTYPEPVYAD
jgi:hypothetical protein